MEMRRALIGLGFALCVGAAAICLALHVATFLTIISLVWIVPPFFLVAGAVLCSKAVEPRPRFAVRFDKVSLVGSALLIYAVFTFIYVIRTITQEEYRMFPNLWTRVMIAWIGMTAVFCAKSFALPRILRSDPDV